MHLRPRFLSRRMAPPEDQSVDLIGALRSQLDTQKRSAPLCEEHLITGSGTRAGCVMCSLIAESRAFSRIDYLLEPPNDMEVSDYDIHCDEDAVVAHVKTRLEQLSTAAAIGATIASYLRLHFADIANEAIGTVLVDGSEGTEPADEYIKRILANGA